MQGTVFWMAPEVIDANKKGYNSKIDIWSVGCVVFEMWTGQRPWPGKEAMAVLLEACRHLVPVRHATDNFCCSCTEQNRDLLCHKMSYSHRSLMISERSVSQREFGQG